MERRDIHGYVAREEKALREIQESDFSEKNKVLIDGYQYYSCLNYTKLKEDDKLRKKLIKRAQKHLEALTNFGVILMALEKSPNNKKLVNRLTEWIDRYSSEITR
jgi:hypothetical protein